MLSTTHLFHLANEHFHSTTTSLGKTSPQNGATDISTRKQTQSLQTDYLKATTIATKIEK